MNIYEVAKKAKVSAATVSRVINNKPNISAKTYEKVMSVLAETNYSPNAIARGLALNSMNMVGIVVDDIRNLYRANVVYYLEDLLSKNNYNAVIFNADTKVDSLYPLILQQRLDVLIFVGSSMSTPQVREFIQTHFSQQPVLMYNGEIDLPNVLTVICDESAGMQLLADHLYRTGRRKPIYVDFSNTLASQRKFQGFREKLDDLRVEFDDSHVFLAPSDDFDGGCAAAKRAIESGLKFDAVVCSLDLLAMGVLYTLQQYGFNIPGDISVTGFDNLTYGKISAPFLTSIDGNAEVMANVAVERLIACISGAPVSTEPVYIVPSLFLGGTT